MLAAAVTRRTLVNILTAAAISVEPVASKAAAFIPTRGVGTHLLAAWGAGTVIDVNAGLLVFIQLVPSRAGAQGS